MQTCDICTNECTPYTIIHIDDNGREMNPNPTHNSVICAECLRRHFDADIPCPFCRQRFLRPADDDTMEDQDATQTQTQTQRRRVRLTPQARREHPVGPHCHYSTTRSTSRYPSRVCEETDIRQSPVDGHSYCVEHFELGPLEMQVRGIREENARQQSIAAKKRRIADAGLQETVKRAQVQATKVASDQYFQLIGRATGLFNAGAAQIAAMLAAPEPTPTPTPTNTAIILQ